LFTYKGTATHWLPRTIASLLPGLSASSFASQTYR
jgi:hypothetical protein